MIKHPYEIVNYLYHGKIMKLNIDQIAIVEQLALEMSHTKFHKVKRYEIEIK